MNLDKKRDDFLKSSDTAQSEKKEPKPETDVEVIERLSLLSQLEYDRVRKAEAKHLNIRVSSLDAYVKAATSATKETRRLPFVDVEPYPDIVNIAVLLDEIVGTIRRFIILDMEQTIAAALWCVMTWLIDVFNIAPLLLIDAPEESCGKSLLLDVIGLMACRPLPSSNVTPSALFRSVEIWRPTILFDEADTFFGDKPELQGMVNAGHKKGGFVLRCEPVGDTFEPRMYSVYSSKALAGVRLDKHLPATTMSRGIIIKMRRKLPTEKVSRIKQAEREEPDLFVTIASKLARFAEDNADKIQKLSLNLPEELSDRDQDNWDSLLGIASTAGKDWSDKATLAALKLSGSVNKKVSAGNRLLCDIQIIFENKKYEEISTDDLITELCENKEAGWSTYNNGKPIVSQQLAMQLSAYGIKSKQWRLNVHDRTRGFKKTQFTDVFIRYLTPPDIVRDTVTQNHKPRNDAGFPVTEPVTDKLSICDKRDTLSQPSRTVDLSATDPVTVQTTNGRLCHSVTDKKAFLGVGEKKQIFKTESF